MTAIQASWQDAISALLQAARPFPVLSREREHELAVRYHEHGDRKAREILINSNLRFVVKIAARYRSYRVDPADLVQEGCLGLVTAVDRFDPSQGNRLLSYAVWRIKSQIQAFVERSWALVRVLPSGQQRRLLFGRHGESCTSKVKTKPDDLRRWHASANRARFYTGLTAPVADGELTFAEVLPDPAERVDATVVRLEQRAALRAGIDEVDARLTDQQRRVLRERLLSETPKTLRELGADLGVSCERVRQVELLVKGRLEAHFVQLAA